MAILNLKLGKIMQIKEKRVEMIKRTVSCQNIFIFLLFTLLIIFSIANIIAVLTITTPSEAKINILTDLTPQIVDGNYVYTLKDGDSLTVDYSGKLISEYKNLRAIGNQNPKLVFDSVGRLIGADFKTGSDGNYIFGNEKIFLSAGTEVHFKDNNAKINLLDGKIIPANVPLSINNKPGESIFEFFSSNNKFLLVNNVFEGAHLKFENGKMFFDFKGNAKLNSLDIINENGVKTYIDFKGEVNKGYEGAYVSIDDKNGKFVTGSNINTRGVKINFNKNNPYGLRILDNDHVAVWSLGNSDGAYIKIASRDSEGRVPKMETLNQFAMNFDDRGFHFNADTGKLIFTYPTVSGFKTASSSVPLEIHNFKGSFNNIQPISAKTGKPDIIGINDNVDWGFGTNPGFIKTATSYTGWGNLKVGFSNSWLYYNLGTTEDLNNFFKGKVTLVGEGYDPASLKILTDMLGNLPPDYWNKVETVRIDGTGVFLYAGKAGYRSIRLDDISDPDVVLHELAHTHDFELGENLDELWDSVSSSGGGYVSSYAGSGGILEDRAETAAYSYSPEYWQKHGFLTDPYAPVYRGKVAVLRYFNMIGDDQVEGLGLDPKKINDYIKEAQEFNRG